MDAVLLVIHLIACIGLVLAVLLQKSEGGALGMGGGGAGGGLMSGRGVAGALVKVTMGLGAAFFVTSLALTRLNTEEARSPSDVERELLRQQEEAGSAPLVNDAQETEIDPLAPVVDDTPAQTVETTDSDVEAVVDGATEEAGSSENK